MPVSMKLNHRLRAWCRTRTCPRLRENTVNAGDRQRQKILGVGDMVKVCLGKLVFEDQTTNHHHSGDQRHRRARPNSFGIHKSPFQFRLEVQPKHLEPASNLLEKTQLATCISSPRASVTTNGQTWQAFAPDCANQRHCSRIEHFGKESNSSGATTSSTRSITPHLEPVHCEHAPFMQGELKRKCSSGEKSSSLARATKFSSKITRSWV